VLVLSVAVAGSVSVPASAAPDTGRTISAVGASSSATAQRLISYISNENLIGIGVSNDYDGFEDYDAILPSRQRTDSYFRWEIAEAYYVGHGYCGCLLPQRQLEMDLLWHDPWTRNDCASPFHQRSRRRQVGDPGRPHGVRMRLIPNRSSV
jgi:hypothetical protein